MYSSEAQKKEDFSTVKCFATHILSTLNACKIQMAQCMIFLKTYWKEIRTEVCRGTPI
jgi:hypothetical protein